MTAIPEIPKDVAVIFLHIPKTAGTTLHQIINRQYRSRQRYHVGSQSDSLHRFKSLPESERANIKLLMGHFGFGIHPYLPGPTTYFTILRDPVARVLSYFSHIRRDPAHYYHEQVISQNMNLETFIKSQTDVMIENGQTRMLAGVSYDLPFGACQNDVLEQAKENLQKQFSFVGLTEKFDESLLLMQSIYGWRTPYYARRNTRPNQQKRAALSPEIQNAILKINQLDQALYHFADSLLTEKIHQYGNGFSEKLRQFRRRNRLLSPGIHYLDEIQIRLPQLSIKRP